MTDLKSHEVAVTKSQWHPKIFLVFSMGCDPCQNSPFMTPHNKKLQYHYAHTCLCVYIYFYFNAENYILYKILSAVYISTRIRSSTVQVSKTYDVYLQKYI